MLRAGACTATRCPPAPCLTHLPLCVAAVVQDGIDRLEDRARVGTALTGTALIGTALIGTALSGSALNDASLVATARRRPRSAAAW